MQAIIFSAGFGTRLKPFTDSKPKALVEAGGKPVLQWNIEKLIAAGCNHIVVNVHHFPGQIVEFLNRNNNFGINILISHEQDEILDTGGGLVKAAPLFLPGEPVIAHNTDVISNLDLKNLMNHHKGSRPLATLVVRNRNTRRYLLFDNQMKLRGWENWDTGEVKLSAGFHREELRPLAFSGIHIISHEIFPLLQPSGRFPIVDAYLSLASTGLITGYEDNSSVWMDIGKPEQLREADTFLRSGIHFPLNP